MNNNYEVMFIIQAELEDDKKEAAIEMVKEVITADGEVGKVNVWGNRKLVSNSEENEGYYVVIEFTGSPELPKELTEDLRFRFIHKTYHN